MLKRDIYHFLNILILVILNTNHKLFKMNKYFLITCLLFVGAITAQTTVFNVIEIRAKDFTEKSIEEAYETCCADMKPNKGGFALQKIGKGAKRNGMTHRLLWFWIMGEDLWEGTNVAEKAPLWWSQMSNYVELWGESYCGRVLSMQGKTNEDYEWAHIWDMKIDDPNQFKTAHDKIVKKFKKEFEGRQVGFGTYDINYPSGATHWVVVSGKDDNDHMMLYDKLQKQPEFIDLIVKRGKVENVRDYMVKALKLYK